MRVLTYDNAGKVVEQTFGSAVVLPSGQNNLNANAAGNLVLWDSVADDTIGVTIASATELQFPAGRYEFSWQSSMETTSPRTNLGWEFQVNGIAVFARHGGNYIRDISGHLESGDSVQHQQQLEALENLTIRGFRQAGAGTVNLVAALSQLLVRKIG